MFTFLNLNRNLNLTLPPIPIPSSPFTHAPTIRHSRILAEGTPPKVTGPRPIQSLHSIRICSPSNYATTKSKRTALHETQCNQQADKSLCDGDVQLTSFTAAND